MRVRSRHLLYVLFAVFCGLLGRLLYIVKYQPAQVVSSQSLWSVTASTTRGTIYDTKLRAITNVENKYVAVVLPCDDAPETLRAVLTTDAYRSLCDVLAQGKPTTISLQSPISLNDTYRLFCVSDRYGSRVLAPHLVGYLDSTQQYGVSGIEASFDDVLSRYSGVAKLSYETDGRGNMLEDARVDITDTTSVSKGGVVLTVDRDIQTAVEELAPLYLQKGAVVVMDPYTGEIKALASYPAFQPATVADCLVEDNGALLNRAFSLYDCGSVFKIVTAAAALENGVSLDVQFTCSGYTEVNGIRFHCHNRLGHGVLDMTGAMAHSCNVYFIHLAQQIGAEALYETAVRFGLDEAILLAEGMEIPASLLPSLTELTRSSAALANFSFGQGYLMTSPLHIARITAAVARDGTLPNAHVIGGFVDENGVLTSAERTQGRTILSASTVSALQRMLRAVVTDGTGEGAEPTNRTASGKTGTAETGQVGGENPVVHQWFTGYFPAENPQYVITVLAEDAQNTNGRAKELFCEMINNLTE